MPMCCNTSTTRSSVTTSSRSSSTAAGRSRSTTMSTVVSADGTVIGYESVSGGPPLLLVHGSTGTRARWSPVRGPLAQRYTVHAMDRRGRGLSTAEAGPYSLQREAEVGAAVDVAADGIGNRRAILSLQREAEDVAAVAEAVGGDVYVV